MRRVIMGLTALLVVGGPATAQERERLTPEQRRELEAKLRDLQEQMRDLERQLGRLNVRGVLVAPRVREGNIFRAAPMTFALGSHKPRLGVIVRTERDAATDSIGAVLEAVTPDGPAAKAGLQAGDIVVTFEGTRVAAAAGSPGDRLIDLAGDMDEGDTVRVAYRRGKETRTAVIVPEVIDDLSYAYEFGLGVNDSTMDVTRRALERALTIRPRVEVDTRFDPMIWSVHESTRWSDMELTTLDADLGSYFGTTEGLLVVRAPTDGLLGLKSGDVIVRIGGRVPTSPSHAMRIFRTYDPGDEIRVDIMRNKAARELKAVVPKPEREDDL
jgi:membrane-associated protease RseP (regulator of RpoE activity)